MRRLCSLLILLSLLVLAPALFANPAQIGGTWRAMVIKQGNDKKPLEDYELLLTFDVDQGTWAAQTKKDGQEQTTDGTYSVDDSYLILETRGGKSYPVRVTVTGNQLVLSPKADPSLRLVALRVK